MLIQLGESFGMHLKVAERITHVFATLAEGSSATKTLQEHNNKILKTNGFIYIQQFF